MVSVVVTVSVLVVTPSVVVSLLDVDVDVVTSVYEYDVVVVVVVVVVTPTSASPEVVVTTPTDVDTPLFVDAASTTIGVSVLRYVLPESVINFSYNFDNLRTSQKCCNSSNTSMVCFALEVVVDNPP